MDGVPNLVCVVLICVAVALTLVVIHNAIHDERGK